MNQKRQQAGTPGGTGGQFAEQRRPGAAASLNRYSHLCPGGEVVGKDPQGGRPVVGTVEGDLGEEDGGLSAYVRVNDPDSQNHGHIRIVPADDLALPGETRRLFDRDVSNLHTGLDEGVAVEIDFDSVSAGAGLAGVIETPPYGEPGDMWAVIRIDEPGHPDHDTLRSVPADDVSPRAAEPTNDVPAFTNISSPNGLPVLAAFNDDGSIDVETGGGAVRLSEDDVARLYAASIEAKGRRHRATLVLDAPVAIIRPGLPPEHGTVIGHRPDGDFIDVRRADGRTLAYPSASLQVTD